VVLTVFVLPLFKPWLRATAFTYIRKDLQFGACLFDFEHSEKFTLAATQRMHAEYA
jgi:uncharacterized membrane protein YjgN (DUF898 family)